jgi:hypothetical protein
VYEPTNACPVMTRYNVQTVKRENLACCPTRNVGCDIPSGGLVSAVLYAREERGSCNTRGFGVTVREVLRTLREDLRMPFPRWELSKLSAEERAGINAAFRERCKSQKSMPDDKSSMTTQGHGHWDIHVCVRGRPHGSGR